MAGPARASIGPCAPNYLPTLAPVWDVLLFAVLATYRLVLRDHPPATKYPKHIGGRYAQRVTITGRIYCNACSGLVWSLEIGVLSISRVATFAIPATFGPKSSNSSRSSKSSRGVAWNFEFREKAHFTTLHTSFRWIPSISCPPGMGSSHPWASNMRIIFLAVSWSRI